MWYSGERVALARLPLAQPQVLGKIQEGVGRGGGKHWFETIFSVDFSGVALLPQTEPISPVISGRI